MALHPTGSDKILEICTDSISFVIKNKDARHSIESRDSSVEITADKLNYVKAETCGVDDRYDFSCPTNVRVKTPPLFFENSDYEIVIKSRHGEAVSVWHEDADIRRKIGAVTEGDLGLLSGIVNFGNNIGYSDFEVSVDGKAVLRVTIEIFPSVIDYKKHYKAMIDDISREVYSSVVDYLQKTYHWLCIGDTGDTSPSVFFQIISAIFEKYVKAANMLTAHPHHKLSAEHSVLPAHKASITDNRSIKWLSRHPESAKRTDKGICATKILAVQKCVIYDTPENRFAKFIILSTVKQLVEFRKRYVDGAESADAAVFDRITAMIFSLKRLVSSTFLKSVGSYRASESMSLVFGMAPGYRELYKYHLMLKKGLSVSGDLFKLSVKDTAVLYEYWCFIKLVSIFKKKKYRLFSDDIIKVDKRGITVDLEKGNKSKITFVNPRTGEKISLCYDAVENEYDNSKSGIVLLDKMSGDGVERLIFSPKYKTAEDKDGNVVPIKEDINELYKYREMFNLGSRSILSSLFGRGNSDAFVLYPCSDENEFEGRGIYNKYSRTGALPFLPEATASAERLIGNLVSDADSSSFDLPVLPYKLEEKLSEVMWDRKEVLVGSVGSVEQFRDNIARKYYYVPEANVEGSLADIRYIALYQSTNMFGKESGIRYFGEITHTRRLKRKDIHFPMRRKNGEEWYYAFRVSGWEMLPFTVSVKDEGVFGPKLTNMFLLQNCTHSYQLFNIHSSEQYRLVYELDRIFKSSYEDDTENEAQQIYKAGNGRALWVREGCFDILNEDGERLFEPPISIADFSSHPRYYYNLINEKMK